MSEVPLLPCPFCGGEATEFRWRGHYGCADEQCGAHAANLTPEQWNRRPAHEPPAILPLPPPAEWFLVGEVRRSWPDGQQMVRLEDYEALRQHIELARAAPCPQCIHGDGAHEETCPLRPAQPPGADRELLFDLWLEINSTDNAPLIPYGLRESIAMQRLRNVVGQYLKTTRPTKGGE